MKNIRESAPMNRFIRVGMAGVAVSALFCIAPVVHAATNKVVIGDIDDMSGLYADVIGPGGIEAAKMAIDDFGGSVLGNKIEFMVTDHQNRPDIGSQKFREWADRDGLTMVLGGSNTGVSIAMSTSRRKRRHPSSRSVRPALRSRVRTALLIRSIMPTIRPRSERGQQQPWSSRAEKAGSS